MTGHIQSQFDGAGRESEIFERRLLSFPTEAADMAVFLLRRPTSHRGILAGLFLRQLDDRLLGDRVDHADSEQRRRIPLRAADLDVADLVGEAEQVAAIHADFILQLLDLGNAGQLNGIDRTADAKGHVRPTV